MYTCKVVVAINKHTQRKIYELHLATKQERLEELKEKTSEIDINSTFQYSGISNSIFGKKRILSRKRIINRILSKQNQNRL